jgi:S1-C subfamily serine protease
MNLVDIIAIAFIAIFVWLGARSGAVRQVLGLAGAIGAVAVLVVAGPSVVGWIQSTFPDLAKQIDDLDTPVRATLLLAALLIAVLVGESVGSGLGAAIKSRLGYGGGGAGDTGVAGLLGRVDALAGAVIGLGQGLLLVWLIGGLLATGSPRALARDAQRSFVLRTLSGVLPPPATVAHAIARVLDDTGAPNPFVGLEPAPAPPVRGPSTAVARQIANRVSASTVKVSGVGCGGINIGTGFQISKGYVATNAHVIAGTHDLHVAADGGPSLTATAVFFDPELDVALLYAPQFNAPALKFAPRDPARGAQGAALGHPKGRPLTIIPGAVSATYRAVGLDIYDRDRVSRDIVELRADVEPGDSGGPFVLPDGTVGGVVFATSKSETGVGYALSAPDVAAELTPAIGRTRTVSNGACVR